MKDKWRYNFSFKENVLYVLSLFVSAILMIIGLLSFGYILYSIREVLK